MATIGYTRVSTVDQNTERQDVGQVERLFTDKASGKNLERPQLQAMLDYIRPGDTVKVYSIDRLARSTKDLLELVGVITAKGCRLEFVSENLQFGGADDNHARCLCHLGTKDDACTSEGRYFYREG